ncbi:LptE family protein [candidate division WOR-3 bacterium]|nr:LptE family protein [candidate division WOR-3 bacterium]
MKKIPQETQYHPQGEWRIRRKSSTIPTKVGIRKKNMRISCGELKAILQVLIRTILRACLEDYREAKRYCDYCVKDIALVICHLVLVGVSCCGYSTRSLLPSHMQKVHIKLFKNQTFKIGLDEIATTTVIEAFRGGSNLRIVDENSADIVIDGKVSGFTKAPYTYTSDQTVIEYKITVKFSVRCVDRVKNDVFWEGDVSDWASYASDEEEAINAAIKKTAENLVNKILTNW